MLSPEQAAELLSVNPSTVRRWLRNGSLEGERYLRWWLVEEEKVLDLLARRRPEWRSHCLTGAQLRAVAYHEAGHAVADWVAGSEFAYVTIIPTGRYLGCVSYTPDPLDAPWRIAQEEAFEFMARMLVDGEDVDIAEGQELLAKYLEAIGEKRAVPEREAFDYPIETEKGGRLT